MEAGRDTILLVDDTVLEVNILADFLSEDYEVAVALDGVSALEAVRECSPSLILLDVSMPGMDGYEVCRRLKDDAETREIPVVFLTATADEEGERRGLKLGAVDYLTKPHNPLLVKARIRAHLELYHASRQAVAEKLRAEQALAQLQQMELLREDLVNMIVHDMRTPLTGILLNLELTLQALVGPEMEVTRQRVQKSLVATQKLVQMVSTVLDSSRLEAGAMPVEAKAVDIGGLCVSVAGRLESWDPRKNLVVLPGPSGLVAQCDPVLTERILENLVTNGLKFVPEGGTVSLQPVVVGTWAGFTVTDNGPGIPPHIRDTIFEKFRQAPEGEARKAFSNGLGLAFCRMATEAQGGRISLVSEVGRGSSFTVVFP